MNRETRTVRPFLLHDRLAKVLDGVTFSLGPKRCDPDGYIVLGDSSDYLRASPRLAWAKDEFAFQLFKNKILQGLRRTVSIPTQRPSYWLPTLVT